MFNVEEVGADPRIYAFGRERILPLAIAMAHSLDSNECCSVFVDPSDHVRYAGTDSGLSLYLAW